MEDSLPHKIGEVATVDAGSSRLLEQQKDGSVHIPFPGWYALFVGPVDTIDTAPSVSQIYVETGVGDSNRTTLSLPVDYQGQPMTDPFVGKAIFMNEGRVSDKDRCSTEEDTAAIPWYLYRLNDNPVPKQHGFDNVLPRTTRKKLLVCRDCLRSFTSMNDIKSHRQEKHRSLRSKRRRLDDAERNNTDSVWDRPLPLIFQDSHIAIVDKPQNMAVHGAKPSLMRSDLLMDLAVSKKESERLLQEHSIHALRKPRPAHRLDAPTGGILVIVKTMEAERMIKRALEERHCQKRYLAMVEGKIESNDGTKATITVPLQGKESITEYRVVRHVATTDTNSIFTLVDLWPRTGRTHQLRRHMKAIGHPIVGDKRYGGPTETLQMTSTMAKVHSRLCLWAVEITLEHPFTKEMRTFGIDEPQWLSNIVTLIQASALERESTEDDPKAAGTNP